MDALTLPARLTQGLSSSVSAMENTQARCQSAADARARVNSGLDELAGSVSQIATAAERQSAVTEEINRSMVNIRRMVEVWVDSGPSRRKQHPWPVAANTRSAT